MDFMIIDEPKQIPAETTYKSVEESLETLLKECKGSLNYNLKNNACLKENFSQSQGTLKGLYWIPKDQCLQSKHTDLLSFQTDTDDICILYEDSRGLYGFPKFLGLSLFGQPSKDLRTLGLQLSYKPSISLRDLQPVCFEKSLSLLRSHGGCTIIADCGFGKTRMGISLLTELQRKTIILCNREVLMKQWSDSIRELCPGYKQGWLKGSLNVDKKTLKNFVGPSGECDIMIASIETLLEGNVPKSILESFGTVIVDEMHHLAAKSLITVMPKLSSRYIIGLSATPDRRDGLEYVLYWLTGPASFVYKRLPSITGTFGSVEIRKMYTYGTLQEEKYLWNGELAFATMTTLLSEDPARNKILLDTILSLQCRKKIIVVSSLVKHCEILRDSYKAMSTRVSALVAGKTCELDLAKAESTHIVFATYSMLEEGYDDPILDTLVLATPRSRIQQTVGRIERTYPGKARPLVIDLIDNFSVYPAMFAKRKKFYASRGFTIK